MTLIRLNFAGLLCAAAVLAFIPLNQANALAVPDNTVLGSNAAINTVKSLGSIKASSDKILIGARKAATRQKRALTKSKTITVSCPTAGNVTLAGTFSASQTRPASAALEADLSFNQCNGVDGLMRLESSAKLEAGALNSSTTASGTIERPCMQRVQGQLLSDLTLVSSYAKGSTQSSLILVTGSMQLLCGNIPVLSCAWVGVDVLDEAALKAGCQ